jgi:hypothetical protein
MKHAASVLLLNAPYAKLHAMSAPRAHHSALRLDRPDLSRLALALALSLTLHLGSYGIYEGGKSLHLWDKLHTPAWIQKLAQALTPTRALEAAKQPEKPREAPLMFVEVNPHLPPVEPPKDAKYYAAQNSRASNPDPDQETGIPKISGKQDKVMRTEDSERPKAQPLQPAPPPPEPAVEVKPKPAVLPGDLAMAKPEDLTRKGESKSTPPRPRTLAEARAQMAEQQPLKTAGQRAKQDGGVRQRNITSSLDAIGSPFGVYDAAIVAAIQNRWYDLLDERRYASDRTGKVVLEFRLYYDGRVSEVKVVENTVDEILCYLCRKAIMDPAPFARWPSDMRRMANADYRDVRFSFYYN